MFQDMFYSKMIRIRENGNRLYKSHQTSACMLSMTTKWLIHGPILSLKIGKENPKIDITKTFFFDKITKTFLIELVLKRFIFFFKKIL